MDFAPERKHELENHARRLRLHLYHYTKESIDDYYRHYFNAHFWTLASLAVQVAILELAFEGEFIYMGFRFAMYCYSTWYRGQVGYANPLHVYFPTKTVCTIYELSPSGFSKTPTHPTCILSLNGLYYVVCDYGRDGNHSWLCLLRFWVIKAYLNNIILYR